MRFFLVILSIIITTSSCTTNKLKEGDLLFQDLNCGDLCNAIEAVTEGVNGRDFSHCAMVVKHHDTLAVIEAIGDSVQINSIQNFIARSGAENIVCSRLKPQYYHLLKEAQRFAITKVGKPYDNLFYINDSSYYCSELLYESFKVANNNQELFTLAPMTFKDPNTQQFFPAWVEYYKALNVAIPEGKPGLNPGSISRSNCLELLDSTLLKAYIVK